MAGKHRLRKQPNRTLRATVAAGIAIACAVIAMLSAAPAAVPARPDPMLAAVTSWEQRARETLLTTTPAPTETDSGESEGSDGTILKASCRE